MKKFALNLLVFKLGFNEESAYARKKNPSPRISTKKMDRIHAGFNPGVTPISLKQD